MATRRHVLSTAAVILASNFLLAVAKGNVWSAVFLF